MNKIQAMGAPQTKLPKNKFQLKLNKNLFLFTMERKQKGEDILVVIKDRPSFRNRPPAPRHQSGSDRVGQMLIRNNPLCID